MAKNSQQKKSQTPFSQKQQPITIPFYKKPDIFILGIIAILSVYIFGSSKGFAFAWDDYEYIINNPYLTDLSIKGLGKIFTTFYSANYHPLTTLSWALELKFAGLNPGVFHLTNLVFHIANSVLVFYFVRLLTKNLQVAGFTALIFAIHPMHVESVAWISARKDVLYSFFYLSALMFYVQYLYKKKLSMLLFTALFFVMSCLSKSAAITLPLMLLLIDYYKETLTVKSVLQKLPFLAVSVLFGVLAIMSQKTVNAINLDVLKFDMIHRIIMMIYSVYFYLKSFFFPYPLTAVHFYPSVTDTLPLEYYIAPLVLLGLTLSIFWFKKYRKELIFGFVFYLISISLIVQLIPLGKSIVSERYSYIPYIGIAILFAKILLDLVSNSKQSKRNLSMLYIGFGIVVLLFTVQSNKRNKVWQNGETLFTDVINQSPNECFGYIFRCYHRIQETNYQGCIDDCNAGLKIDSNATILLSNRGVSRFYLNDFKGALTDFDAIIKRDSTISDIFLKRGKARSALLDNVGAIHDFEKALQLNPSMISICLDLSLSKLAVNDVQGAIAVLNNALSINPDFADAYYNRGNCYFQIQKYAEAINDYSKAIGLNPKNDRAICNRGVAKSVLGDMKTACDDFKVSADMGNQMASQYLAKCK